MKKIIYALFAFGLVLANAAPADAYVEKKTALVRVMNKAAGKAHTINIPVGVRTEYEKLGVLVRTCKQTDPFKAEDFVMFVEITKNPDGRIFSGWMSRNEPGDNPLQNADYDLWLERCE